MGSAYLSFNLIRGVRASRANMDAHKAKRVRTRQANGTRNFRCILTSEARFRVVDLTNGRCQLFKDSARKTTPRGRCQLGGWPGIVSYSQELSTRNSQFLGVKTKRSRW